MTASNDAEAGLRNWLVDYLVTTIGCSPSQIDLDATLNEMGVGSRDAVVLSGELSELLNRPVSPVDFWQHPTINALARYLVNPEADTEPGATPSGERIDAHEPIAVIGLGCRLPGDIHGPEELWHFLAEGRSAVSTVPEGRWQAFDDGSPEAAAVLARTTRWGSFLTDIDAFDAEFFDISPGEAARTDPQQRLLLEVAVEALDHAGIPADSLHRSRTGVFAGACVSEYGYLAMRDLQQIDAWTGTGGALSIIANRLSYFLDLRGPSVTVDTACSSSLVAIHLACQSLRTGESELAIAAGVNLTLSPAVTRSFDQVEAMSQTGACRAFDAAADGFVRGEGCGVAVLKRLSDAVRDGDRVLAVVRGSAINQDGRSNGLMAPNPAAQTAVLRAACVDAGLAPVDVDYVEAHGTGTLLGDPIEARALGAAYGRGRQPDAPLYIGSVKTNLGHLEAAAGVVGFIKTAIAVERGEIPANLHFTAPNPHIPFGELGLEVVSEPTAWPVKDHPRRAGVSSFGFGGTNAHVVLEQPPTACAVSRAADETVTTLVVSGKTPERVARWAGTLADWMSGAGSEVRLADVAHTLNHHRTRHSTFATVAARGHDDAVAGLQALSSGHSATGVVPPHQGPCIPGTVFVYSGQGSQWAGMGRRLLVDEPAFAAAIADLEPDFVAQTGFSLQQVLADGEPVVGIERIQPVLVAVQLALTALWRSHGVQPDVVIGHSMGEVSAAVVSGALSAADGLRVIATRSRLMARLSGMGAMALVELDANAAEELVAGDQDLTVAVYASLRESVIAGPPDKIAVIVEQLAARDRLARLIDVDVASHHPTVDPVLPELREALADLTPGWPTIPVIATTGGRSGTPTFDADYWADNLRNPVRFTQAISEVAGQYGTFIEVSPHPLLTYAISGTAGQAHHHSVSTLQRGEHDGLTFRTNLNTVHTVHPPQTPHPPEPHRLLPAVPWQHARYWLSTPSRTATMGAAPRPGSLLGERITVSTSPPVHLWQARLLPSAKPYPGPHRLHGVDVVPASVLTETVLLAAAETGEAQLTDIEFLRPVIVDRPRFIQVVSDGDTVTVSSSASADAAPSRWIRHVSACLSGKTPEPPPHVLDATETLVRQEVSMTEQLAERGIDGPPYDWSVDAIGTTPSGLVVDVILGEVSTVALLDAAMHVAAFAGATDAPLMVPASADRIHVAAEPAASRAQIIVTRAAAGAGDVFVDVTALAPDGTACVVLHRLRYVALDPGAAQTDAVETDPRRFVHRIDWQPHDANTRVFAEGSVAVVGPDEPFNAALLGQLTKAAHHPAAPEDARYVIYVAGHPDADLPELDAAAQLTAEVTALLTRLVHRREPSTLWILTRGVREAADGMALRQSCLWGLAQVISAEQPEVWGGLLDLPDDADVGAVATALAGLLGSWGSPVLALQDGEVMAPALVPVMDEPTRQELRCRPDAAYLITGGLGALGLLMADWLADRGARRLVLAGRTPLPPRSQWDDITDAATCVKIDAIRALEARGVTVDAVALDVASAQALRDLVDRRDRDGAPPIRGVIHAAGVTQSRLLTDVDTDEIREVLASKVGGADALHQTFAPESVDFLFLTSSAATVFGIPGQGAYAAGNAYLDALARARHRRGGHTLSIDWVAWRGLGFAAHAPLVVSELERLGSRPLAAGEAFTAWEHAATFDLAQAVVMPVSPGAAAEPSVPARDWSQMPTAAVRLEIEDGLRAILARELRLAEAELPVDLPFAELGLNSMMAMSIRREAEGLVGVELSATMLWNHPTVAALAAYLTEKVVPQSVPGITTDTETGADIDVGILEDLFDSVEATTSEKNLR